MKFKRQLANKRSLQDCSRRISFARIRMHHYHHCIFVSFLVVNSVQGKPSCQHYDLSIDVIRCLGMCSMSVTHEPSVAAFRGALWERCALQSLCVDPPRLNWPFCRAVRAHLEIVKLPCQRHIGTTAHCLAFCQNQNKTSLKHHSSHSSR